MVFLHGIVPRLNLPVHTSLVIIYIAVFTPILVLLYFELANRRFAARTPKGCRKLGLYSTNSNLDDEHEYNLHGTRGAATATTKEKTPNKPRIKALVAYPLKSCKGIEFNIADFVGTGLAFDRQFCFAEYIDSRLPADNTKEGGNPAGRWDARTLRDGKYSKLALIRPEIWVPDPASSAYSSKLPAVRSKGVLVIHYPRLTDSRLVKLGMKLGLVDDEDSFQVPLYPPENLSPSSSKYTLTPLRMFHNSLFALDYGHHVPASLAQFLESKKPLSLFRAPVTVADQRVLIGGNVPSETDLGFKPITNFPDEYPLQVQNLASIRDIAARTKYAIPRLTVRRFRPNIVLEGLEAYTEDSWRKIRFFPTYVASTDTGTGYRKLDAEEARGGVDVHVPCRTVRCRLPNVDPDTGERHPVEPDKTLRTVRCIDPGNEKSGCLGMMLLPTTQ
ncbi:hypothetical protein FQN57_002495, partial [Myotisia sp. PD_48]